MAQATISPSIAVFQGRAGGWPGYPTFTDPTLFYIASPLVVNWASGPITYTFSGGVGIPQQAQIPQTFYITLSDVNRNGTASVFIDTDTGRWAQAAQASQPFAALGIIQSYVPGVGAAFGPSGPSHQAGPVPDPGATQGNTRFLREDATFATPVGGVTGSGTSAEAAWFNGGTTVLAGASPAGVTIKDGLKVAQETVDIQNPSADIILRVAQSGPSITNCNGYLEIDAAGNIFWVAVNSGTFHDITLNASVAVDGATGNLKMNGNVMKLNGISTAISGSNGTGVAAVFAATLQKSETGADAALLSFTPAVGNGSPGQYRLSIVIDVSAASAAVLGWTATWKDANGNSIAPTNLSLYQVGVAAPALTFTTSAAANYYGSADISIDSSGTAIVIKLTFSGTSVAAKVTASLEQLR